jgi:hypothetical protein
MANSNAHPSVPPKYRGGYRDDQGEDGSDNGSGSGTQIGSPIMKETDEAILQPHSPRTTGEKLQLILLAVSFTLSGLLLFVTVSTASQNNSMLATLQPYAVDLANVTNKTWGYGSMPVEVHASDRMGGHKHGAGSKTATALDPEDTAILYGNMWENSPGNPGISIFPTTSDALDEQRPNEVVTYDTNFLVKKHVSSAQLTYSPSEVTDQPLPGLDSNPIQPSHIQQRNLPCITYDMFSPSFHAAFPIPRK